MVRNLFVIIAPLFFLTLFAINAIWSIQHKSITVDEKVYIPAGYTYLTTGDYRLNKEHPPVVKLIASLPLAFIQPTVPLDHSSWDKAKQREFSRQFMYYQNENTDQMVFWSRVMMVVLGILLGLFLYLFSKRLYGMSGGLFSLLLYSFSPTILAYTRLVSLDFGVTVFGLLSVFLLWRYLELGNKSSLFFSGIMLGLTIGSKFSGFLFVPILFSLLLLKQFREYLVQVRPVHGPAWVKHIQALVVQGLVLGAVAFITLLSLYQFVEFGAFIEGYQWQLEHNEKGHDAFLLGDYSRFGWWYYFFVAFLVKVPLSLMIMFLFLITPFRMKDLKTRAAFLSREVYLLLPIIAFFFFSTLSTVAIGIRYILPVFPFLFILLGRYPTNLRGNLVKQGIMYVLPIWFVISSISVFPHYLTYFNEVGGGESSDSHVLLDSNIDWGQDLKLLSEYMKENGVNEIKLNYFGGDYCDYRGITCSSLPCEHTTGLVGVSVNKLVGLNEEKSECYQWLREYEPFTAIGNTIYLYDITE